MRDSLRAEHEKTRSDSRRPSRRGVLGAAAATALPLLGVAPRAAAVSGSSSELFYVSTWTAGEIHGARFDAGRGTMTAIGPVAAADSGWATAHPVRPVLYVGSSKDGGVVSSYAVDPATGALRQTGQVATDTGGTGGGGLAHLAVDEPSHTLLVANFEAGLVASLALGRGGALGAAPLSVVTDTGSGPNPRQLGPHPHHVVVTPDGRHVLVADFGADRVFAHGFDRATGTLSAGSSSYATAPGSGPRRLVFHPDGRTVYLLNELTADLQTLQWRPRSGELTSRQLITTNAPGHTGTTSAAELALSRDGRFVYASNRGENSLVVLAVDARTRLLTVVQRIPCGGTTPWSFTVHRSGRWLFVANEASGTVDLFGIDRRSGQLAATGASLAVPTPDCVTFWYGG
ncbi:Lactonase, 7-bladed beta propeller [Actinobacteria bacterium OK074]|nr:Lactonase, 7-bladed beta propeller [Actinobacteria bacterium OK074]